MSEGEENKEENDAKFSFVFSSKEFGSTVG